MAKKISVLAAALFLFSCAQFVTAPIRFDPRVFMNNYNKMFSAAISKGTQMKYSIDYQDREHGLLKMSRKSGNSTYRITVKFYDDNFTVQGDVDTDLINPFIGKDAKMIENAIKEAAR